MDNDEANILKDLLPDLQLVNGIISKHQSIQENIERRQNIPKQRRKGRRSNKKHRLHQHLPSSFIKTKTISIENLEPKDVPSRSALKSITTKTSTALETGENDDGQLQLHEIDFDKLLQKLSESRNGGEMKRKRHNHRHTHHYNKKRKRHRKKSAAQKLQTVNNTKTSQRETIVNTDTDESAELHKLLNSINMKEKTEINTSTFDKRKLTQLPPIQSFTGRVGRVIPQKRIIPQKEQFLVLFHKNTTTLPAERQRGSLEGSKHHEIIIVNDIKAFHRLESIASDIDNIRRVHSLGDNSEEQVSFETLLDNSQANPLGNIKSKKYVSIGTPLVKISSVRNTITAGEKNHARESKLNNRVNRLKTAEEQKLVTSIEKIGKSIGSVETNVTDSKILNNNNNTTALVSDYSKAPTKDNSTESSTNSSSLSFKTFSDAKATNESILRNAIIDVQVNNNSSSTQNNTNAAMEFETKEIGNDTQGKTSISNSSPISGDKTESSMHLTKSGSNSLPSIQSQLAVNQTSPASYGPTVNNRSISTFHQLHEKDYSTNNNSNINNNNNNNKNNNGIKLQQFHVPNKSKTSPDFDFPQVTTNKPLQQNHNISTNETLSTITKSNSSKVLVDATGSDNTDMMQIMSKNLGETPSDINVPLVPFFLYNDTKNNQGSFTNNHKDVPQVVLPNKTEGFDTKLDRTRQMYSAKENTGNNAAGDLMVKKDYHNSQEVLDTTNNQTNQDSKPTKTYSESKAINSIISSLSAGGDDLMSIPAHPKISFNLPSSPSNHALYQVAPQRKNIIPTPDPRDRLAREYIPLYSPSTTSYSEEDGDFLDDPTPKQLIEGNSIDKSETTSLKNFLEDERLEEQSITYEANSANNVKLHQVKVVDPVQRALNERKKQGREKTKHLS